jgi:hypothetical protein
MANQKGPLIKRTIKYINFDINNNIKIIYELKNNDDVDKYLKY